MNCDNCKHEFIHVRWSDYFSKFLCNACFIRALRLARY